MKQQEIKLTYLALSEAELGELQRRLVQAAKDAARTAYAPYSHFSVGAAVLLKTGEIITGSNQENAASPEGTCAERCALFAAGAAHPDVPVVGMAVAAHDGRAFTARPITPCGGCRQVMAESARRGGIDFNVLLYGTDEVWLVPSQQALLPLAFASDALPD